MIAEPEVFERLRVKTADLLGLNLEKLTPLKALKLDRAVLLRLELDRLQAQQAAGEAVDLGRMKAASEQLEELLPRDDGSTNLDLSLLSDEELKVFEDLVAKSMGAAPAAEPSDDRQPDQPDLLARMSAELDELRRANTTLVTKLEAERARVANLEAQKAAQPEDEVETAPLPGPRIVVDNGSPHFR